MTQSDTHTSFGNATFEQIRQAWRNRQEIALLDIREEAHYAQAHPLFTANLPLGRIELDSYRRIPRLNTPIVIVDEDAGLTQRAAALFSAIGYTDIRIFGGGNTAWQTAGGELFADVNSPSKAFGELVEHERRTPSISAIDLQKKIDGGADMVILDARRQDEFEVMSIPTAINVPGAELVLRAATLAPSPATTVVVNCAGRTRSIIGAQSLVNAALPNPVLALRNGTIGWTLAGQRLAHGRVETFRDLANTIDESRLTSARAEARRLADRAGVKRGDQALIDEWNADSSRSTYRFDVRTAEEYAAGHLPGFLHAAGGQLVQETDHQIAVRGARIILTDDDGVRANMTASWLAQMGWETAVADLTPISALTELHTAATPLPTPSFSRKIDPDTLAEWLTTASGLIVLDFATSARHRVGHIPNASFTLRRDIPLLSKRFPEAKKYVLTCGSSLLAAYLVEEVAQYTGKPVFLLEGGNQAWREAGHRLDTGLSDPASSPIDRYRRPYEGTDNPQSAMQAYLDWEFGLVAQLDRDGNHHFTVL